MKAADSFFDDTGRKHPNHGVYIIPQQPTIVFVTVCSKNKVPWMAQKSVQNALCNLWNEASAWLVGDYMIMPNHVHLFCAPYNYNISLKQWITFWKRKFTALHLASTGAWLRDFWDTRLRRNENYSEKWHYVRNNPVRAGLVKRTEDWPFQGQINVLRW